MPNPKQWTVMVYLAGDNNLNASGTDDLLEMKQVGTSDYINIVAQFDSESDQHRTKRYFLTKGTNLAADEVGSLGPTNTGDPKNLIAFANWAITAYPAQRYLLVLWNHGQGWDDTDIYAGQRGRNIRTQRSGQIAHAFFRTSVVTAAKASADGGEVARAILLDDNAKDFLDNVEMKQALAAIHRTLGRKIDLLGMDACLMSMGEVGYQMRDHVSYTIGSEETEPGDGWPYNTLLAKLAKNPAMSADALGKIVVKDYIASYKGGGDAVTQSLCDLGKSDSLAAAVKSLATALKTAAGNPAARSAIRDARDRVQTYAVTDNADLADLCTLLKSGAVSTTAKAACDQVLTALQGYVVASGSLGKPLKNSHGAAIYFPTQSVSPLYARLDFVKKTGWGAFLKAYLAALRSR